MEYVVAFILAFLALRLLVVITNFLTQPYLRSMIPLGQPEVSVLVPARNEADNLPMLLSSLMLQQYSSFKVFVYNDLSSDGTAEVVRSFVTRDPRIVLINAEAEPPDGWLGKNHACHHLARLAQGEYMLFLDADVEASPSLISDALGRMQQDQLDLMSVFPVQTMVTTGERLVVPLMHRILLSLLPLILTRHSKRRSLSAANGQLMMFRTSVYQQHLFHQMVKSIPVEDISIFRMAKSLRLRTLTLLSSGQISCRMYKGFEDALHGFSKNVLAFFGGNLWFALFFLLITTLGWLPMVLMNARSLIPLWLAGALLINMLVSLLSKQSLLLNLLLAIPQQWALVMLVGRSLRYRIRGGYHWKGRRV